MTPEEIITWAEDHVRVRVGHDLDGEHYMYLPSEDIVPLLQQFHDALLKEKQDADD